MSFLGDLFNPVDAVQDTWSGLASLPGTPEALGSGIYGGLNGDLSWNPYSQDNSVWDTGAGGTELSQDPNNRRYGRTIGTAIGAAFTGGALAGAAGEGAGGAAAGATDGAGSSALAIGAGSDTAASAPALSLSSQGAIDAQAAGYGSGAAGGGLASQAQNGAIRGATQGSITSAANGGNGSDIVKGGLYGGLYGGVGGGVNYELNSANPGSYATNNQDYQKIINKGLQGGVNAGLQGKSVGQGTLLGAGTAGGNMAFNSMFGGSSVDSAAPDDTSYMNYGSNGYAPTAPVVTPDANTTMSGDEQNPLKRYLNGSSNQFSLDNGTPQNTPGASLGFQGLPTMGGAGGFGGQPGTTPPNNTFGNLLGLYSAYKQHAANSGLQSNLSSMYGQNSPYAQQMAQTLARTAAASGRRSDVGSQQVALQAALAAGNSRNAPEIASLNNSNTNGMNAGLNNLYQLYQGAGGYGGLAKTASPYLSQLGGMFGG